MVMYRDFVKRGARASGLVGYVKNLPDGTVEMLAQGPKDKLETLLARVRKGSLLSRVDNVDVQWRLPANTAGEPTGQYSNFSIV